MIKGSVAEHGRIVDGADIDLCVITPVEPEPAWFEEIEQAGIPVEMYPVAEQDLQEERVLTSPDLPFAICRGIVLHDPDRMLITLRDLLLPRLCDPKYRLARAEACYRAALAALRNAREALERPDVERARGEMVMGIWNASAIPSAIACLAPTNRRSFVRLEQLATRWHRRDLVELAEEALGARSLTAELARELHGAVSRMNPRAGGAVAPLLREGQVRASAWPTLLAAVTGARGAAESAAREQVFTTLGFAHAEGMLERIRAAEELCNSLWSLAQR